MDYMNESYRQLIGVLPEFDDSRWLASSSICTSPDRDILLYGRHHIFNCIATVPLLLFASSVYTVFRITLLLVSPMSQI